MRWWGECEREQVRLSEYLWINRSLAVFHYVGARHSFSPWWVVPDVRGLLRLWASLVVLGMTQYGYRSEKAIIVRLSRMTVGNWREDALDGRRKTVPRTSSLCQGRRNSHQKCAFRSCFDYAFYFNEGRCTLGRDLSRYIEVMTNQHIPCLASGPVG